jgi:hypothetical protein
MKKVEKKGKIEIGRDAEGRGSKKGSERDQEKGIRRNVGDDKESVRDEDKEKEKRRRKSCQ